MNVRGDFKNAAADFHRVTAALPSDPCRGGLTTKLHLRVICNGLPVQIELSPGQMNDQPMAMLRLKDLPAGTDVIADKGYDADWIREMIEDRDCTPVYPAKIKQIRRHHLQQTQIQETQSDRTMLQQTQAVQAYRYAIRPINLQLSRNGKDRLRPPMAQVL